jgi:hypothetical protein
MYTHLLTKEATVSDPASPPPAPAVPYTTPQSAPAPAAPAPRKSRKGLVIGLSIGCLLLLSCCCAVAASPFVAAIVLPMFGAAVSGPSADEVVGPATTFTKGMLLGDPASVRATLNADALSGLTDAGLSKWQADMKASSYWARVSKETSSAGTAGFEAWFPQAPEYGDLVWRGTWSFKQNATDPKVVDVTLVNGKHIEKSTISLVGEKGAWKVAGVTVPGESAVFTKKSIDGFFTGDLAEVRKPVAIPGVKIATDQGFTPEVLGFGWDIALTNSPYRFHRIADTGTVIPQSAKTVLIDLRLDRLSTPKEAETFFVGPNGKVVASSGTSKLEPGSDSIRQGAPVEGWAPGEYEARVVVGKVPVIVVPFTIE